MSLRATVNKIAKVLSILLGPHIWGPVVIIAAVLRSGLDFDHIKIILPLAFLFIFIIPMGYLHLLRWQGKLSSWDMTLREERPKVLFVGLISISFSLISAYFFANQFLFHLTLIFVMFAVVTLAITKFWKISLHMEINVAGSIILNFLFNWQLPVLYLTIPVIFWARYQLKKHSLPQLLAGTFIGMIAGSLIYFGL